MSPTWCALGVVLADGTVQVQCLSEPLRVAHPLETMALGKGSDEQRYTKVAMTKPSLHGTLLPVSLPYIVRDFKLNRQRKWFS